jgi:hypothetical protein
MASRPQACGLGNDLYYNLAIKIPTFGVQYFLASKRIQTSDGGCRGYRNTPRPGPTRSRTFPPPSSFPAATFSVKFPAPRDAFSWRSTRTDWVPATVCHLASQSKLKLRDIILVNCADMTPHRESHRRRRRPLRTPLRNVPDFPRWLGG